MDRRRTAVLIAVWVALALSVAYLLLPEPEQTIDLGRDQSNLGD